MTFYADSDLPLLFYHGSVDKVTAPKNLEASLEPTSKTDRLKQDLCISGSEMRKKKN